MALPLEKHDAYFTGSRIFCPTKIILLRYHKFFLWKTKGKAVRKIIEDLQKSLNGGVQL